MEETTDHISEEEQKANAFLRQRFLYLISTMPADKTCKIKMYENTEVSGTIKAFDMAFDNMVVANLSTPQLNTLDKAIIRTGDVISISYEGLTLE